MCCLYEEPILDVGKITKDSVKFKGRTFVSVDSACVLSGRHDILTPDLVSETLDTVELTAMEEIVLKESCEQYALRLLNYPSRTFIIKLLKERLTYSKLFKYLSNLVPASKYCILQDKVYIYNYSYTFILSNTNDPINKVSSLNFNKCLLIPDTRFLCVSPSSWRYDTIAYYNGSTFEKRSDTGIKIQCVNTTNSLKRLILLGGDT